jgi:hypothetical protein
MLNILKWQCYVRLKIIDSFDLIVDEGQKTTCNYILGYDFQPKPIRNHMLFTQVTSSYLPSKRNPQVAI